MKDNVCFIRSCLTLLFALTAAAVCSQTRTISGTVVDETGEPVIGATIVVNGTQSMTITDLTGSFRLDVPNDAKVAEISYVGYETVQLQLAGKSMFRVQIKPADLQLEEVVVIGYGTAKRGNVTGSIASVKAEKLEDRPNENALSSLQGQLAGVEITNNSGEPGGDLEVHIRGAASINADDQPLYVVDGIPVDDLNSLNPDDIESIDVLKDASSSAIYGSRGANGVVLIKTKTPQETDKVSVQFSASFGLQQMEHKLDVMTSEEWIAWRSAIIDRAYVEKYGSLGATASDDYAIRLAYTGGSVSTSYVKDPRWSQTNYGGLALIDWQDELYRLAPKQTYNLSIANKTARSSYRVSLGYVDQQGIAINTSYKRLNLRANLETEIFKGVTVGFTFDPSFSWKYGATLDAVAVLAMVPVAEPEAGVYTGSQPYQRYTWAGSRVSPVAQLEQTDKTVEDSRVGVSAFVRAQLMEGLKLEVTGSYNFKGTQTRTFTPSSINSYWTSTDEGYYTTSSRQETRQHKYLFQAVLNYDRTFGRHTVGGMLGASIEQTTSNSSRLTATQFPDNLVSDFSMSDVELTSAYTSTDFPVRLASYFGRAQYEYDNRYLVNFSLRRDGSSKFGANRRWGMFPAVSVAWRTSNERFWPEDFFINSLKIRGSWGANGNNSISSSAAYGVMSSANYSLGGTLLNGYAPTSTNNDYLTWEKVYSWNIAVDLSLFRNRISLSFDYYQKTTSSLLYKVTMPAVIGYSTVWDNVGEVQNKGYEIELTTQNIVKKKFKWSTTFNLSYNENKVTDLGNNDAIYSNENTQVLKVGEPMNSFYMYEAVGVYQTQEDLEKYPTMTGSQLGDVRYRDVNDDGVINDDDRTLVGKPNPDFIFGLTNKFTYKNFDLSILINGQWGGQLYSLSSGKYLDKGQYYTINLFSWWQNMWVSEDQPGDGRTPYLFHTTGDLYDTRWLYDSDYIRIKSVTLGYKIPISKKIARSARVYATVENLWMWDKYDGGYSPENKGSNTYPQARTYTLGVNLTF